MSRIKHHTPYYDSEGKGEFDLSYHLEMISDLERVRLFKEGIDKLVDSDSIFCELGCGTGIFSIYAAIKAKKVYAIEIDENVFAVAKRNVERCGLADKIVLICGDVFKTVLPEKVDVVFCEMLSTWLIEEPQVLAINHAKKNFLKSEGIIIPEKIINLVELCNMDYKFGDIEFKTPFVQFTGIKHPRIMTESKTVDVVNFIRHNKLKVNKSTELETLTSGLINSARLSSIVKISEGVNFYSTDTLMPLTIVPLKNELNVKERQKVIFNSNYKYRSNLIDADFQVMIKSK